MLSVVENMTGRKLYLYAPFWWLYAIAVGPVVIWLNIHPNRFKQALGLL